MKNKVKLSNSMKFIVIGCIGVACFVGITCFSILSTKTESSTSMTLNYDSNSDEGSSVTRDTRVIKAGDSLRPALKFAKLGIPINVGTEAPKQEQVKQYVIDYGPEFIKSLSEQDKSRVVNKIANGVQCILDNYELQLEFDMPVYFAMATEEHIEHNFDIMCTQNGERIGLIFNIDTEGNIINVYLY